MITSRPVCVAAAALLLAWPVIAAPGSVKKPPHVIHIVGYNDMREMLTAASAAIEQAHPDIKIDLDLPATKAAPSALIDGRAALAPMGAAMLPAEREAVRARWGNEPVEVRIAHDSLNPRALSSPVGVLVAPDNPLREIRLSAVRAAFTGAGQLRWGDLGARDDWADKPVHAYTLASDTAIGRYLLTGALVAQDFAPSCRTFHQSRDVISAVAADRYGIGLANLNHADGPVRALAITDAEGRRRLPDRATIVSGAYPFDRVLLIYARRGKDGAVEPDARLVLDFLLSRRGQAIIEGGSLGYLPLNAQERAVERRKLGFSIT